MRTTELLLVAGPGRSGTSIFSMLAHRLGWLIPQPEVEPNETNPHGFGETMWAVEFHRRCMRRADITISDGRPQAWDAAAELSHEEGVLVELCEWLDKQMAASERILVKDPRLLWFLGLWRTAAEHVGVTTHFATMLRHPAECVASREQWYGNAVSPTGKLSGWINGSLGTEHATRGFSRVFVPFEDVLTSWPAAFSHVEQILKRPFVKGASAEQIAAANELVDTSLRRSHASWSDLEFASSVQELADEVWNATLKLVDDPDAPGVRNTLDQCNNQYRSLYAEAEQIATTSIVAARRRGRQEKRKVAPAKPRTPPTEAEAEAQKIEHQPTEGGTANLPRDFTESAVGMVSEPTQGIERLSQPKNPVEGEKPAEEKRDTSSAQLATNSIKTDLPVRAIGPVESWHERQDLLLQAAEEAQVAYSMVPRLFPGWILALGESSREAFLEALTVLAPHDMRIVGHNSAGEHRSVHLSEPSAAAELIDIQDFLLIGATVAPGGVWTSAASYPTRVQFWQENHDGSLTCPPGNPLGLNQVVPRTFPEKLDAKPLDTVQFPIDLVYLWVDDSDPQWQQARARALGDGDTDSSGRSKVRFRNRDELRYSMRSAHYYAPWVRTIHLVTMGQHPDWLIDHERVNLVDHTDIIDGEALPTFNSNAIIARLHHVPGLAEHYILMNDDVFLGRPMAPNRFFNPSGHAKLFLSNAQIPPVDSPRDTVLDAAQRNVQTVIAEQFGVRIAQRLKHGPHPQLASFQHELEDRFASDYELTVSNRFRTADDTDPLYLHGYIGYLEGKVVRGNLDLMYSSLGSYKLPERIEGALANPERFDALCLNDTTEQQIPDDQADKLLADFLDRRFPIPAPWETF